MNKLKTIFATIAIIIGLLLIFSQSLINMFAEKISDDYYNTQDITILKKSENQNETNDDLYNPDNISTLTSSDFINSMIDNSLSNLNSNAKLIIPSVNMNLPIFNGLTRQNLMVGAGTMKKDQFLGKGNYALASHSVFSGYNSDQMLFSPLHRIRLSANIYVISDSKSYRYKVTDIYEVTPDAGYVIDDVPGKTMITLITCTDLYATKRIVVQGQFVEEKSIDELSDELKSII